MKAAKPTRATGTLTISLGLVNVPVAVYPGTQDVGIKRSRFSPEGNPVGMQNFDKVTGAIIEHADLNLRFQTDSGDLVELTDEEIAAATGTSNGTAEIIAVLGTEHLERYAQESILQIRPANGSAKKVNPVATKTFALLMQALQKMDAFALVRYSTRGKARIGAVTPDGYLRVLYFDDEVREALPMPEADVTDAELSLAIQLLTASQVDEAPMVEDEASAAVRSYAATKAAGGEVIKAPDAPSPVTDLMAALEKSVQMAKAV